MLFKNLFKRIVDENKVSFIIKEFISKQDIKILAYHKITKRGIVEIHTDRPCVFIGRNGINIKSLKYRI